MPNTKLLSAAMNGNINAMSVQLSRGADVETKRPDNGATALIICASKGCEDGVKILLDWQADVHAKDNEGCTAIMRAILNGMANVIPILLKNGAGFRLGGYGFWTGRLEQSTIHFPSTLLQPITSTVTQTALHFACKQPCTMDVMNELLVSDMADAINETDSHGNTALHIAVAKRPGPIVRQLIAHGAEINAKDSLGRTPLHLAILTSSQDEISVLLNSGADPDQPDLQGKTPLHFAVGATPPLNLSSVEKLLNHGVQVDSQDTEGNSALHIAVMKRYWPVVKKLIDGGAQTEVRCNEGLTPLMMHLKHQYQFYFNTELLDRGANINARDWDGNTALHLALKEGHFEKVAWIIDRGGADIEARNNEGFTPLLMHLQSNYDPTSSQSLLDKGADINAQDNLGNTALHWAVSQGHEEKVKWILDKGGDFMIQNNEGKDSVTLAVENHRLINTSESAEIFQMLQTNTDTVWTTSTMTLAPDVNVARIFIEGTSDKEPPQDQGQSCSVSEDCQDKPCAICFGARRTKCVFLNCFHSSCCYECAMKIFTGSEKKCPICRKIIINVKRIYE